MVGSSDNRKGFDIFIKLPKMFPHYIFCWVGCNQETDYEVNENQILIKKTTNPYFYQQQFDYFLLTSREETFPICTLESLYLGINTIMMSDTTTNFPFYEKHGALIIHNKSTYEN